MEIAVYPDAQVNIKAPQGIAFDQIQKRVMKRARWILKQIEFFRQFEPRTLQRRFVSGETHLYLGRQYRLKIKKGREESVKMARGFINVVVNGNKSSRRIKQLIGNWYFERAQDKFEESLSRCWPRFKNINIDIPELKIRGMKRRWGSVSRRGRLTLNIDLVRAPKDCIDYVVIHELCHAKYRDHSPRFYQLLEKKLPDWQKRKNRLEQTLA